MSGAITMVEAMRRASRDSTRDKLIAALESVKDGEAGPAYCKVNFDATRRQGCLDATMWTLRDDKIVNIGTSWAKTN